MKFAVNVYNSCARTVSSKTSRVIISILFEDPAKAYRFFQPIIDNLNALQINGLSINDYHVKFTFSTMVADNLAANMIGGFQTSFSSGYFCRRCYIKYSEKHLPISVARSNPRTYIDHDKFVQEIVSKSCQPPWMGITGPSLMKTLIGFHPAI